AFPLDSYPLPRASDTVRDEQPASELAHSHWGAWATFVWIGGAGLGLVWMALGSWQASRLLRPSQAAPPWITAELAPIAATRKPRVNVRTSVRLASAVALRARKPVILLPQRNADPASAKAVRAALAHEWAHICHGDLWLLALERLLLPLLALHPLFWWLR